jgi:glycosyltransferase involved in cell wall biosynthesis
MSFGIYMPAYNVENYISEAIQSIQKQTYTDWHIVIVDDSSTDKTYEVASSFQSDKIKVIKNNEHSGLIGKLKNQALGELGDEIVCHIGADDLIPTYTLKMYVDFLNSNSNIGVCCGSFLCFDENKKWIPSHANNLNSFSSDVMLKYMCLFPLRVYRRKFIDMVGGYSEELTSAVDYDLGLKLDEVTQIYRIASPVSYFYRQHSGQVSKKRNEQNLNAKNALQSALNRRGIGKKILNDSPPFELG